MLSPPSLDLEYLTDLLTSAELPPANFLVEVLSELEEEANLLRLPADEVGDVPQEYTGLMTMYYASYLFALMLDDDLYVLLFSLL